MSLNIIVKEGRSIPSVDKKGLPSSPMVELKFQGTKKLTEECKNTTDPIWNKSLKWNLAKEPLHTDDVRIKVLDKTFTRNRFIGMAIISMQDIMSQGSFAPTVPLYAEDGDSLKGEIDLEIIYSPLNSWKRYKKPPEQSTSPVKRAITQSDQQGLQGKQESQQLPNEIQVCETTPKPAFNDKKSFQLSNKSTNFQVRVHIIQGRGLIGGGLINPVVKVKCENKTKRTLQVKGSYNPFFDNTFHFNFFVTAKELFDIVILISVVNSKLRFQEALLGSHKLDVGFVYNQPRHCFIHKWLLLTDPKNPSFGVKGYLKASINIIGPGDIPVTSPSVLTPETDDIEDNLLRPSGVHIQKCTLYVRLYLAEHLPQMDPEYFEKFKRLINVSSSARKDLVDPYCKVSFAGHELTTRTIPKLSNPVWNQQLNFPISIPSLCDRVTIQLIDEDDGSADDYIGTCFVNITKISDPDGFHPTFGPSFINVYGSPREFSVLPNKYDYMNKGKMEGVAYRGRILVEIGVIDRVISKDKNRESIKTVDVNSSNIFRGRKNFKLLVTFLSATMIRPGNSAIEFEASIGIYGNIGEVSTRSQSSTTPPVNPVVDSNVASEWEDNLYRLEAQNMLLSLSDSLERDIWGIKHRATTSVAIPAAAQLPSLIQALKGLLLKIKNITESSNPQDRLPLLPKNGYTQLDDKKKSTRIEELNSIVNDINDILLKSTELKLEELLHDAEQILSRLYELADEPQNNIPDIVIWMLSGGKRVACHRIPAHKVLYSNNVKQRGSLGGVIQDIFLKHPGMEKNDDMDDMTSPGALVRCQMWFGLEKDQQHFHYPDKEAEIGVYAETYHNVGLYHFKSGIPEWSDAAGKISQPRDKFILPNTWKWKDKEFNVRKEFSIPFELKREDIFEYQTKEQYTDWSMAESSWHDINGVELQDYSPVKDEHSLTVKELSGKIATDENGWEYTTDSNDGLWVPYDSNDHCCRRRIYVRERKIKANDEGWEYARSHKGPYNSTNDRFDTFKRRRELREMVPIESKQLYQLPVFNFRGKNDSKFAIWRKKEEEIDVTKQQSPRVYLSFKRYHACQLRAHIYQGRDLYAADVTGFSDPFCVVSFDKYTMTTLVKNQTLGPIWNQTLVFDNVILYGDRDSIVQYPPPVIVELFDEDTVTESDYMGMVVCKPYVRTIQSPTPALTWYEIERYGQSCGDILTTFELFILDELKPTEQLNKNEQLVYEIPRSICPKLVNKRIEVLCWGLRDMKKLYGLVKVSAPLLEIQCGEFKYAMTHIRNAKPNCNFPNKTVSFDVIIPEEDKYAPPIILRLLQKQAYGRYPVVGVSVIKSLSDYSLSDEEERILPALSLEETDDQSQSQHDSDGEDGFEIVDPDGAIFDYDWWSKYYETVKNSDKVETGYLDEHNPIMMFYETELEKVFRGFSDVIQTFNLYRGKGARDLSKFIKEPVGYFKGKIRAYNAPTHESPGPQNAIGITAFPKSEKLVVRVYIVEAIDLQPRDLNGKSDPYLVLKVGNTVKDDKVNYQSNLLDVVFGKCFEFNVTLPQDYKLKVKVMDHDVGSENDLIGETDIDLENRWLSKHRALCGLSELYIRRGPNQWRDVEKPVDILNWYCKIHHLPRPVWEYDKTTKVWKVTVSSKEYFSDDLPVRNNLHLGSVKQQLALNVLRTRTKPFGEQASTEVELVPEHIETRTLHDPSHPGFPQGYLRMWVDIFPADIDLPPQVNISPRKAKQYTLRIVIYDTKNVELVETSSGGTGEDMTDIYVKGWISGENKTQTTDVHYRSMDGEGNFNWRFVFPFRYLPAERMIVVNRKDNLYSVKKTERRLPPIVTVQLWDNNIVLPNKYIGTLDLNLNSLPSPVERHSSCSLEQLDPSNCSVNLFHRRTKGWWQFYRKDDDGKKIKAGTVNMEMEIVSLEEEELRPAAVGRKEPNSNPRLQEPNRPTTSFLWLTSPLRTFKYIIWKYYKWYIIFGIVIVLAILAIALFIYSAPKFLVEYSLDRLLPF